MTPSFPPLHEDLDFHGPLSGRRADDLADFLGGLDGGSVLDVGCGWAELLLRVLEVNPALRGVGVDLSEDAVVHGRALARTRGLQDRVRLVVGDASKEAPASAAGVICIGAGQIWGSQGAVDLDYAAALGALRALVPRGGRVVFGEAVWSATPTEAAMAALGGAASEFLTLPDLVDLAVAHGLRPFGVAEATLEEWDGFESGYGRGYERWLLANDPESPDYADVVARADQHRRNWLHGYRGVLGLAYLQLVAC